MGYVTYVPPKSGRCICAPRFSIVDPGQAQEGMNGVDDKVAAAKTFKRLPRLSRFATRLAAVKSQVHSGDGAPRSASLPPGAAVDQFLLRGHQPTRSSAAASSAPVNDRRRCLSPQSAWLPYDPEAVPVRRTITDELGKEPAPGTDSDPQPEHHQFATQQEYDANLTAWANRSSKRAELCSGQTPRTSSTEARLPGATSTHSAPVSSRTLSLPSRHQPLPTRPPSPVALTHSVPPPPAAVDCARDDGAHDVDAEADWASPASPAPSPLWATTQALRQQVQQMPQLPRRRRLPPRRLAANHRRRTCPGGFPSQLSAQNRISYDWGKRAVECATRMSMRISRS
jgi:hypothetical protein